MTTSSGPTGFAGLSHLGIVSSIAWASFGRRVIAYDPSIERVEGLASGNLPVHEPGLRELLAGARDAVTFSNDPARLSDCPVVIVSLDVPTGEDHVSDLAPVFSLVETIMPVLRDGVVLVIISQVPPGFTRALASRVRAGRPGFRFTLYYLVETLIFGRAVERALKPERFIVGCADPSEPLAPQLAGELARYGCPVLPMRYESAELAKTAINLYLIGAVTYANVLSDLCGSITADWNEIIPALRLDQRIGPAAYLRPGLGIAGGNLERDLATVRGLCYQHGVDAEYLGALAGSNDRRHRWILEMLREHVFAAESSPTLAVWGLTYKRNTKSVKNSPALKVLRALTGRAEFRAWDPVLGTGEVDVPAQLLPSSDAVLEGADALLILSDWEEFSRCDVKPMRTRMRRPIVIDCVGALEGRRKDLGGILYLSMGRPPQLLP
jgi:UDPglucose 6-dehydrogenase